MIIESILILHVSKHLLEILHELVHCEGLLFGFHLILLRFLCLCLLLFVLDIVIRLHFQQIDVFLNLLGLLSSVCAMARAWHVRLRFFKRLECELLLG